MIYQFPNARKIVRSFLKFKVRNADNDNPQRPLRA
jgi:hypothetical protein